MQNIYGTPPPPPEEHYEVIEDMQKIVQGMRTQGNELEKLAQANELLTRSNSAVMEHLEQMTATTNIILEQLKTLASAQTNQARPKRKQYCWICGRKYTHWSKTFSPNK